MDFDIGDTDMFVDRYKYVKLFSQPYMESHLDMVDPTQRDSARDVFSQFVKLSYDPDTRETYVTSFSIEMLDVVMKQLHYSHGGTQRILTDKNVGRKINHLRLVYL